MLSPRDFLKDVAHQAMRDRGFEPEFPAAALRQLDTISPASVSPEGRRDLRELPWCSIDNDDSRDLDQLTVAQPAGRDTTRILVAIADVGALVERDSPIDRHAAHNTTSVYTGAQIFPMLPERLSTDLTSLNAHEDRAAHVIAFTVNGDGEVTDSDVYAALVRNQAQLAYPSLGAWLEGRGPLPERVTTVKGLEENLRLQDAAAQALKQRRHDQGALTLEMMEPRPVFEDGALRTLQDVERNHATELIEDFMIAANGAVARFLESRGLDSIRRVVRVPQKWPRIVELAAENGDRLPNDPDSQALETWLLRRRAEDPLRFPDLSLSVVKLLGRGEYVVERPGAANTGHFGLAVQDYTHATAPNRRFSDLVTQRMVGAAVAKRKPVYHNGDLTAIAARCTEREDAANKVERLVRKAAAAMLLSSRIGERFEGVVTGAADKGTWVRIRKPPVEGRVERGYEGLRVGDKVRVKLIRTDPARGFIDFVRV
jgi:exoribonuclease-2